AGDLSGDGISSGLFSSFIIFSSIIIRVSHGGRNSTSNCSGLCAFRLYPPRGTLFIISQVTFHRDSAGFIILLLEILIASYEVNINPRSLIFIIFLAIALAISVVLNLILFSIAKQYYAQLNGARLDPLALSAFPVSETILGQPDANAKRIVFFGDSRAAMW